MEVRLYTKFIFSLFLLISNSSFAQIQKVEFNLVEGVNGVTVRKITGIIQDPQGYICGLPTKPRHALPGLMVTE